MFRICIAFLVLFGLTSATIMPTTDCEAKNGTSIGNIPGGSGIGNYEFPIDKNDFSNTPCYYHDPDYELALLWGDWYGAERFPYVRFFKHHVQLKKWVRGLKKPVGTWRGEKSHPDEVVRVYYTKGFGGTVDQKGGEAPRGFDKIVVKLRDYHAGLGDLCVKCVPVCHKHGGCH